MGLQKPLPSIPRHHSCASALSYALSTRVVSSSRIPRSGKGAQKSHLPSRRIHVRAHSGCNSTGDMGAASHRLCVHNVHWRSIGVWISILAERRDAALGALRFSLPCRSLCAAVVVPDRVALYEVASSVFCRARNRSCRIVHDIADIDCRVERPACWCFYAMGQCLPLTRTSRSCHAAIRSSRAISYRNGVTVIAPRITSSTSDPGSVSWKSNPLLDAQ